MNSGFVNPLKRRAPGLVDQARSIKQWTRESLSLTEDTVVSVNELACHVPGCPPQETVILVIRPSETVQASIHKAMADVAEADIQSATWSRPLAQR
ncbi:hypothetical protein [Rhizobium sp. C4]|uniref:hypothetical protein n=1 Tax=Rhizobium sp. C4 TaxID=1349800 RepID=UPI001E3798E9|nr:hypothetical protein [Rhizobium sp. C4]MCD2174272.1 hypothetical protein [Rhizobium sp. C4]